MTPERTLIEVSLLQLGRQLGPGYLLKKVVYVCETPDGLEVELVINTPRRQALIFSADVPRKEDEFSAHHSPDFRSVRWYGTDYKFGPVQAQAVRCLWEAAERGSGDVSGTEILRAADSDQCSLSDLFRDHPAWKTLILGGAVRGTYRLAEPPAGGLPLLPIRRNSEEAKSATDSDDDEA